MSDAPAPQINIGDLVAKYIKVRDKKAEIMNEAKSKCAQLESALEAAEAAILKFFEDTGMDAASCEGGTAYKSTKTSATVADRDTLFNWVRETGNFHFLESRVSKTAVDEYVEKEGDLPPGVNYSSIVSINVRRS